jgi:hypothetical protein
MLRMTSEVVSEADSVMGSYHGEIQSIPPQLDKAR